MINVRRVRIQAFFKGNAIYNHMLICTFMISCYYNVQLMLMQHRYCVQVFLKQSNVLWIKTASIYMNGYHIMYCGQAFNETVQSIDLYNYTRQIITLNLYYSMIHISILSREFIQFYFETYATKCNPVMHNTIKNFIWIVMLFF